MARSPLLLVLLSLIFLSNVLLVASDDSIDRRSPSHAHAHGGQHRHRDIIAALKAAGEFEVEKRQNTPGAAEQKGTANPEPAAADLNNFKVEDPSTGTGGDIKAFTKRDNVLEARQQTTPGSAQKVGTANAAPGKMNTFDEQAPSQGNGGSITAYSNTKRSVNVLPRAEDINWAPHHLATRGLGGGRIELFSDL